MQKFLFAFAMALCAITLQYSHPSIASADTFPSTLITLITSVQTDDANANPPADVSWGHLKSIYRGNVTNTPTTQNQESGSSMTKPGATPNSIGSRSNFVRNECWYALNHDWLYRGDDVNGPSNTESNWNWLSPAADANVNGLRYVLNVYGGFVSDLIPGYGGDLSPADENYWAGRLSNNAYALGFKGSGAGHGTQCVSFVAMVIYRATGGAWQIRWNWDAVKSGYGSATLARPGDIVFHTSGIHHVGICVVNYGSGITIVDSNSQGNEVIRRHNVSNSEINSVGWKVMSGAGKWN